jgi:hypothetical protein
LGAGCSYGSGLPDGNTLAAQLLGYAGGAVWEIVYNKPPSAYWAPLRAMLTDVLRQFAVGGPQSHWALDQIFDRFHELMRGDPAAMGPAYGLLFDATAQLLYTRSCYAGTTDAYRKFVEALEPGDIILTFNWDTCPEIALHHANRPFSRQMNADAPEDMPWLLKLHGSIDYLIVDIDVGVKGSQDRPEFLEALGAVPPSPIRGRTFELARLRTYDLGFEVELDAVAEHDRKTRAMSGVVGGTDVGPYMLTHALTEYPTLHMLTPGSPRALYDWQYHLISRLLAGVCQEVSEITVAGYSFPDYDRPVHQVLRTVHKLAGNPTTHIVNPAAAKLDPQLLKSIFGTCELHAVGFGDHTWRR